MPPSLTSAENPWDPGVPRQRPLLAFPQRVALVSLRHPTLRALAVGPQLTAGCPLRPPSGTCEQPDLLPDSCSSTLRDCSALRERPAAPAAQTRSAPNVGQRGELSCGCREGGCGASAMGIGSCYSAVPNTAPPPPRKILGLESWGPAANSQKKLGKFMKHAAHSGTSRFKIAKFVAKRLQRAASAPYRWHRPTRI